MLRKLTHSAININKAKSYVPYQDLESKMLLDSILRSPGLWTEHIRQFTNSITTQLLFGFRTSDENDPKRDALYRLVEDMSELVGSTAGAILEVYPLARNLPGILLPSSRQARKLYEGERSLFGGLWLQAKRAVLDGTSKVRSPFAMTRSGEWWLRPV